MKIADIEKKIKHLSPEQVLTVAINTINRILIDKGITTIEEIRERFLRAVPPPWQKRKKLLRKIK